MAKLVYPKKPWVDGQKANLMTGMQFVYSASLKKWVPITPGFEDSTQLQQAFGVKTVEEVEQIFTDVETLKEEMLEFGRIWKTEQRPDPSLVYDNDVWIDPVSGVLVYWKSSANTWIQLRQ